MRVVVSSESASEREQFRLAALALGLECATGDCVSPDALSDRLALGDIGLALIALGLYPAQSLAAVHACSSVAAPVYVVSDASSIAELPNLLRAGAQGYLRKEELRGDLLAVVQTQRSGFSVRVATGRVFAVTGGLPGVGVTTVATNLAFALAEKHPNRVALAQLTDGVADLALNLALSPAYPLADLAAGWYRLDNNLMRRCLVDHPAGVSVLADQFGQGDAIAWEPAAMRQLLMLLRGRFEFVVLDLGHSLDSAREEALRMADAVGVVQRLDVPALRIGKDWLDRLREIGVSPERLLSIANRFGQREQVSWNTAHEVLATAMGQAIPDDPACVNFALNAGRPLAQSARSAAIAESFAKLADHWDGTTTTGGSSRRVLAEAS
jgi:pilus assembly protein CpaE